MAQEQVGSTSQHLVSNDTLARVPVVGVTFVLHQVLYRNCCQLLTQSHSDETPPTTNYCTTLEQK